MKQSTKIYLYYYYHKLKKINRQIIIKFLLATAIFYALLALNVFNIGDIISPPEKDYIDETIHAAVPADLPGIQYIQEALAEIYNESWHLSADQESSSLGVFEDICALDVVLCRNIYFQWDFTQSEKALYLGSVFAVSQFIDKNIVTNQQLNMTLTQMQINKSEGKRRWYATWNTILINTQGIQNKKEFINLIAHEVWHVLDLWMIQWKRKETSSTYTEFGKVVFALDDASLLFYGLSRDTEKIRKASSTQKDFCSGYGMTNPFEDFAECFNLYLHHNRLFQFFASQSSILRKKYNFMATLFGWKYLDQWTVSRDKESRPRDTTKL